jgi:hypothetical protein
MAGDLARSCDEQLLDAFLAIKRIIDERSELIERNARGLEAEEVDEDVYDEPTDGEDGDAEPAERTGDAMDDEAEPPSEAYPSDDDAPTPPTAVSGGGDYGQSSDQQGHVLPYNHPPELLCLTEGCNRRRRRYFEPVRGIYRWVVANRCCRDCVVHNHCSLNLIKTSTVSWAPLKTTR